MSSNDSIFTDWHTPAFRQNVIMHIEEALKKSQNEIEYNKTAAEIEEQIFEKSASRDNYMSMVARIILHSQPGQDLTKRSGHEDKKG